VDPAGDSSSSVEVITGEAVLAAAVVTLEAEVITEEEEVISEGEVITDTPALF